MKTLEQGAKAAILVLEGLIQGMMVPGMRMGLPGWLTSFV